VRGKRGRGREAVKSSENLKIRGDEQRGGWEVASKQRVKTSRVSLLCLLPLHDHLIRGTAFQQSNRIDKYTRTIPIACLRGSDFFKSRASQSAAQLNGSHTKHSKNIMCLTFVSVTAKAKALPPAGHPYSRQAQLQATMFRSPASTCMPCYSMQR